MVISNMRFLSGTVTACVGFENARVKVTSLPGNVSEGGFLADFIKPSVLTSCY